MADGHHVHLDGRGMAVPGCGAGHGQSADRRVGNVGPDHQRSDDHGNKDGSDAAGGRAGTDPSLGLGESVYGRRVPTSAEGLGR